MLVYLTLVDTPEDQRKFELVYTKYRNLMYHTAYKLLHNHHDAEDCVHEAFLSIIKHLDKIDIVNSPRTASFVIIITERKAIDLLRSQPCKYTLELNEAIVGLEIPLPGDNGLADCMAKLPAHYREILLLKFDNGYSNKELAQILNISESGIRKLLGRAKKLLKEIMEKEGVDA